MANFCTKCGKKLEDGKKCTCEKIKKQDNIKNEESSLFFENIEDFLSKPFDKIKNMNNLNENSYLYLLCSSLSIGLINMTLSVNPFGKFITTSIISYLILLLFSLVIYQTGISFGKENWTLKKVIDIVSISSVILSVGNVLAFLIGFLSLTVELIIILLTIVLFIIFVYQGIISNSNIDKNKIGYLFISSIFITILCLLIIKRII